jgi:hypothetical protein
MKGAEQRYRKETGGMMPDAVRCPQCDAVLPSDSVEGLCPQCLLRLAIATVAEAADTQPIGGADKGSLLDSPLLETGVGTEHTGFPIR